MRVLLTMVFMFLSLNSFAANRDARKPIPLKIVNISVYSNQMPPRRDDATVTTIEFDVRYCKQVSERDFYLSLMQSSENSYNVAIYAHDGSDCRARATTQRVRLVTTQIPLYFNISVLNPLLVEYTVVH